MKTALKWFFVLTIFCLLINPTSALALGPKFGFGPEIAIPTGDMGDAAGVGFGAAARLEKGHIIPGLGFTLTAGFIQFSEEDTGTILGNFSSKVSVIPIQFGVKYTVIGTGVYGILEAGIHRFKTEFSYVH